MSWSINYHSRKAQEEVLALPPKLQARYFRILEMVNQLGPLLGENNSKSLGGGLYELRIKAEEGIARATYVIEGQSIVILTCFIKKTDKTPPTELQRAKTLQRERTEQKKKKEEKDKKAKRQAGKTPPSKRQRKR